MPKITQNNIIMWLEDVVPQMQKAEDPVDCLLKYAKEHNFSPAILERVGHMFNSLKLNSAYNLAKEAAHRGDYISTLDVPMLVEKYSSFSDGLDLDNLIISYKAMGLSDGGPVVETIKLASASGIDGLDRSVYTHAIEGDISELCLFDERRLLDDNIQGVLNRFYSNIKTANDNDVEIIDADDSSEASDMVSLIEQEKELRQNAMTASQRAMDIQHDAVNKFASKHYRDGFKDFDQFEHNLKSFVDDEYFNKVFDKFAEEVKSTVYGKSSFIKRASTDDKNINLGDSRKVDEEDANLVYEYYEAYKDRNDANAKYQDFLSNKYAKMKLRIKTKPVEERREPTTSSTDKEPREIISEIPRRKLEMLNDLKNRVVPTDLEENSNIKSSQNGKKKEISKIDKDLKKEENNYTKAVVSGVADASKLLSKAVNAMESKLTNFYTSVDNIKDVSKVSPFAKPIAKEMNRIEADAILQQLLFTDPVLSKLNDDETDALLESYETIIQRNPSIATDKGLLRSVLRQAVNINSVDLPTAVMISKLSDRK